MKKDFAILMSWMIRYSMLLVVFVFFPVFTLFLAKNYEHKAMIFADTHAADIHQYTHPEEISTLDQQIATTLQHINDDITGDWAQIKDDTYVLRIKQDNSFEEYYKRDKFAWGTWRVYSALASSTPESVAMNTQASSSALPTQTTTSINIDIPGYFLYRVQLDPDSKGDRFTYRIYQLNGDSLTLVRIDNDKILTFTRSTSTVPMKSADKKT